MTKIFSQEQAKEAIKNTCIQYNLHQYIPAVQKAFDLDTMEGYKIMILKLEGKVSGMQPTDMNLLIQHQGESKSRLIIQELKNILKETKQICSTRMLD